jgi:hypothetical protein
VCETTSLPKAFTGFEVSALRLLALLLLVLLGLSVQEATKSPVAFAGEVSTLLTLSLDLGVAMLRLLLSLLSLLFLMLLLFMLLLL